MVVKEEKSFLIKKYNNNNGKEPILCTLSLK